MAAFCHRFHGKPYLRHASSVNSHESYPDGTVRISRLLCEPSVSQRERSALPGPLQQPLAPRRIFTTAAHLNSSSSWHEQGSKRSKASQISSSSATDTSSDSQKPRTRHYIDSTSRQSASVSEETQQQQQPQSQQSQRRQQNDDGPGWWQVPRESRITQHSTAAAAEAGSALDLEPWQEERLLRAVAGSKKKMQVQALAADLGLDRSEVLSWNAAFRAKPKQEQQKLLAPLQHIIQQQQQAASRQFQQQQRQQHASDDLWGDPSNATTTSSSNSNSSSSNGSLPFSESNADTGFVPFHARRDSEGKPSGKRLPGEVLRTLEGVYNRSPWPSKEVVAGLHDLHRLPRDVVQEWFTARREMDGLPDNPRLAKKAAAAAGRTDAQQSILTFTPQQQQRQQQPVPQAALDRLTVKQLQAQHSPAAAAAAAAAGPAVSRLTARDLATLRSSLPSPKKFKGAKLSEELGIKEVEGSTGTAAKQVEISGVIFVARDGAVAWRRVWRRRRALSGLPAQRLDLNKWLL